MRKLFFSVLILYTAAMVHGQTLLDTAVNFTVKDPYGNTYYLFDILQQEKIVVIDFFSTT
jgi:hypothetical protein